MVGENNEAFLVSVWKSLPGKRVLKLEGKPGRVSIKRTISASGGFGLLQMVSEPDTGQCASEDAGSPREVDYEIPRWLEKRTKHSL